MKHAILPCLLCFLIILFAGCNAVAVPPVSETTAAPTAEATVAATALPTESAHSPLYIPGGDVEDVILYFNEVCLDAEIVHGGDASLLQKWREPIYYQLNGDPTDEDVRVIENLAALLNTVEGFPGMYAAQGQSLANLQIHFCSQADMLDIMGQNFTDMDGAVTFWYLDDTIYDAIICCRADLSQTLRNSVIQEEIYNGLGPIQDTWLRADSIIYADYAEPQALTDVDLLILQLLYHPALQCGMNAAECEAVIRTLYW